MNAPVILLYALFSLCVLIGLGLLIVGAWKLVADLTIGSRSSVDFGKFKINTPYPQLIIMFFGIVVLIATFTLFLPKLPL